MAQTCEYICVHRREREERMSVRFCTSNSSSINHAAQHVRSGKANIFVFTFPLTHLKKCSLNSRSALLFIYLVSIDKSTASMDFCSFYITIYLSNLHNSIFIV